MKIDLSEIKNNEIVIDNVLTLDKSYYDNTEIRSLSPIKVSGSISYNDDIYTIELTLKGEMILPCAVSLEDVVYPFDIEILETIGEGNTENEDYLEIIDNSIDIMPIIWQNIVVEIPMRITCPKCENVKMEGEGWRLLSEEEKKMESDSRLDKLRDLLDD